MILNSFYGDAALSCEMQATVFLPDERCAGLALVDQFIMSTATNAFGSSSGSEGPGEAILLSNTPLPQSIGRPSAFVCQRCLRLLDMYPLYSELSNVEMDLGFDST